MCELTVVGPITPPAEDLRLYLDQRLPIYGRVEGCWIGAAGSPGGVDGDHNRAMALGVNN
jgi:hypothetical protein